MPQAVINAFQPLATLSKPMNELSTPASTERRLLLLFFLVAFVLLAAGIGLRDPWPSDEPRFTLVAKQMV